MATSGHCSTNEAYGRYLTFNWKIESQSIENNTTTISWSLDGDGDGGYVICTNFYVEIDGKVVYNLTDSSWRPQVYNYTTVLSDTYTIKHNADGSRSFSVKIGAGIYDWTRNDWGSGSWTLTSIPRAASISSAPNFTDEDNPKITYSNPAGTAASKLEVGIFDTAGYATYAAYREVSRTGTSYTFNLTAAERETLQKAVLSGSNTKQVKFYIRTTIGSNKFTNSSLKTLTIANAAPTISPTVIDSNSKTVGLTGDASKLIRYHSDAKVAMNASFKKHATAKTYKITNGNTNVLAPEATLAAVEKNKFDFSVTDTRGLTASRTITSTMIDYVHLTCNLEVTRPNALGEMSLKIHGNCFSGSFGAVNNTLALKYYYKEDGGTEQAVDVTIAPSNNTYSIEIPITGLDYRKKYTFRARAVDKLEGADSAVIETYTLPVFDWSKEDFNFNVPVTFEGSRMNDFVVEQGKMAGWNFRRWNSGIAECWFITDPTNFSISTSWGGLYTKDNAFPGYSYPFEFASLPVVSVQPYATDGNFWCFTGSDASTTQSPSVSVVRPTSYSVTGARISMYVIGREKR